VTERETAVRVERLSRRFGELVAVGGISFDVARGELFGIVGPDGAGKTTTLRMLAGVLRPTAGDAHLFGTSVAHDPESVKAGLAYMPQRFGLYTDLTVEENIAFYADLYEVPRTERPARLERLWQFSNLEPFRGRLAGQLSGGMKQKLGLCCALVHEPRLLLLDEPTFGVDPISRRDLWLIVHDMVARGVTVIASTAYLDEAERFDRLALLHKGEILSIGTPGELRAELRVELLEVRTNRPQDAARLLREHPAVRSAAIFGESVHVGLASIERDWPAAERSLKDAGLEVLEVERLEPSLEDVFLERVGSDG
jgi:ABC-2 type transport system ATP-binding protein